MAKILGFLIDPEAETITEVEFASGDLDQYYKLIDCDTFTHCTLYPNGDGAFVDDEGLFKHSPAFFQHANYPQPIAGRGLFVGIDREGETVGPSTSLEDLLRDTRVVVAMDPNGRPTILTRLAGIRLNGERIEPL